MKKYLLLLTVFLLLCLNIQAQTIIGIDLYHGDDPVTWSSVKSGGYGFAWHKSTQGTTYTDPDFVTDMVNGEAAGMYMGAYHFADPENNSAKAEADYFLSVAKSYIKSCEMPPVLDLEDPSSGPSLSSSFSSAALTAWVQEWFDTVQKMTGITPVLYTDGTYAKYLGSSLNKYPLWIATVSGSPSSPPPAADLGSWTTWTFNQYSWTLTVPGVPVSGGEDGDVFNGDSTAFKKFIGCIAGPPPPPPVCDTIYASLPYSTSFENTWAYDSCAGVAQRLPDFYWKSSIAGTTPDGDDYWHRDDYTGGDWSTPTSGAYTPAASNGTYSARFHNDPPPAGSIGNLDLYIDLSGAGTKTISFDYIHNELSPSPFAFDVELSTDGGKTFSAPLLSLPAQASSWTNESFTTSATSAKSVIRFTVTDKGTNDVGIDNLSVVTGPTGISAITANSDFTIYPNPNNGSFTLVTAESINEKTEIEIYNALGQQVYSGDVYPGKTQINMNAKESGMYFYRIMSESGDRLISEGRIIVQH
jgi:GH25 family lysozyme M1 (1,4-beta-N-acetylmuramidase)